MGKSVHQPQQVDPTGINYTHSKKNLEQSSTSLQNFLAHYYSAGSISGPGRFSRAFAAQENLPGDSSELTKHWYVLRVLCKFYELFENVLRL